jgi:hypothetical protein
VKLKQYQSVLTTGLVSLKDNSSNSISNKMFSYFTKGTKNCTPDKKISIEALVKEIRKDNKPIIQQIRTLDINDLEYNLKKKALKNNLPYITPCCMVSYRNDDSIKEFSGYMYFDIDNIDDAVSHKMKLIEEYKEYISMICLSCSGTGLSILTKIENEITALNFDSIREYICRHIFKDLDLDPKTKSKSNAWYVSYDPNCYFNSSSVIEIPEEFIRNESKDKKKGATHNIINTLTDYMLSAPSDYNSIDISEVYRTLKFRTEVVIENRIFDMKTVDYCEVYIPHNYKIDAGHKMRFFGQIIHCLVYLNPNADPEHILSYILYLNYNKTVPGTASKRSELERFFKFVYDGIKKNGILNPKLISKTFHCKPNTISREAKNALAKRMSGLYKMERSISAINLAREYLMQQKKEGATYI